MAAAACLTPEEVFSKEAANWDAKPLIRELTTSAASILVKTQWLGCEVNLLDFGCGTGLLVDLLLDRVRFGVGVDTAPGMVLKFNEKIRNAGKSRKAVAVCVDILDSPDLPAVSNRSDVPRNFELIVSLMTFHHVDDIQATVSALTKFLCPGGHLVVFDLLDTPTSGRFHPKSKHHTVHHEGGFRPDWLVERFQQAGLVEVEAKAVYDFQREVEGQGGPDSPPEILSFSLLMVAGKLLQP